MAQETISTEGALPENAVSEKLREVRHEYTLNWPPILGHINCSLLVTTYQAGKLAVIGSRKNELVLSYHNFEKAMGLAVDRDRLAVGTNKQIWFMRSTPELSARLDPIGTRDGCFLARSSHFTGQIQIHEMAWSGDSLFFANTLFSCICTFDDRHSFLPVWRPKFISDLAAEDRCHLNGLTLDQSGRLAYVTAMAESNSAGGWRASKNETGCLIDAPSGETVVRGLSMPHSPRIEHGRVWLLDSGRGRLVVCDLAKAAAETVCELPGYTRGLAIWGQFAFVGLSKIRETSTFGGVPIAANRDSLKCGVAVVDLASGKQMALLEFHSGIEEIFDVKLLPGVMNPAVSGTHPELDDTPPIWMVPASAR